MGITVSKEEATKRFGQALVLARSDGELPAEWLERAEEIGRARSKTFTSMLGTALLAKATDRHIDAFSLRDDESHKSYSARSLAKDVLVPCCARAGIDIRNRGAEPLNNQPFLRALRISPDLKVKKNSVEELKYLCECLERVDFLEGTPALLALASFLRVRITHSERSEQITVSNHVTDLGGLSSALATFLAGESEGGRVGQGVVSAVLDLVFDDVRTKPINDPSTKWPGDVGAFVDRAQTLCVEVKQRPITDAEILLFAKQVHGAGICRAHVVALAQENHHLDLEELRFQARRLYAVDLTVFIGIDGLLSEAFRYAEGDVGDSLEVFQDQVLARLREMNVSITRQNDWVAALEAARAVGVGESAT